jgi:hypothetical protein
MNCANFYYFYMQIRNIFVDLYNERNTLLGNILKFYYDYPIVLFMLFTVVFMIRSTSKMMCYESLLKSQMIKTREIREMNKRMEIQIKRCLSIMENIFQNEEYQKDKVVVTKMKNMKSIIDEMLYIIYETKSNDFEKRIEKLMDNLSTYKLNKYNVK